MQVLQHWCSILLFLKEWRDGIPICFCCYELLWKHIGDNVHAQAYGLLFKHTEGIVSWSVQWFVQPKDGVAAQLALKAVARSRVKIGWWTRGTKGRTGLWNATSSTTVGIKGVAVVCGSFELGCYVACWWGLQCKNSSLTICCCTVLLRWDGSGLDHVLSEICLVMKMV